MKNMKYRFYLPFLRLRPKKQILFLLLQMKNKSGENSLKYISNLFQLFYFESPIMLLIVLCKNNYISNKILIMKYAKIIH